MLLKMATTFHFITILCLLLIKILEAHIINNSPQIITAYGLGEPISFNETAIIRSRPSIDEYRKIRNEFLQNERTKALGADLTLNDRESLANNIIMNAKYDELKIGFQKPNKFAPSRHFFEVFDEVKTSNLFKLLKAMPKGGVLHAHDTALCSTDYVVSLTYRPDLWQCEDTDLNKIKLKFAKVQPLNKFDNCEWVLVADERSKRGKRKYDYEIRKYFSLYTKNPQTDYKDINEVWSRFDEIFLTIDSFLTYVPVWKDYFNNALKEFYEDGVQYLEIRTTLPHLYDLDGKTYEPADIIKIYYEIVNDFKRDNPGFIGAKVIYGPNRKVDDVDFETYMKTLVDLYNKFPNFIAGFDVVGQEDMGRPLFDYANELLTLPESINFFFHAGETNWNGMSTDENLIDAILLGTKRIGHGYAIIKHPKVLEAVRSKGIAVEINPISNQVLKLNDDNRNHPSSFLIANNYPIVISSDDPSLWGALPLSHDFYMAFLGISSSYSDLKTLKQLAINSIAYSSLNVVEKELAFRKWEKKWNEYIEWVIKEHGNNSGSDVK